MRRLLVILGLIFLTHSAFAVGSACPCANGTVCTSGGITAFCNAYGTSCATSAGGFVGSYNPTHGAFSQYARHKDTCMNVYNKGAFTNWADLNNGKPIVIFIIGGGDLGYSGGDLWSSGGNGRPGIIPQLANDGYLVFEFGFGVIAGGILNAAVSIGDSVIHVTGVGTSGIIGGLGPQNWPTGAAYKMAVDSEVMTRASESTSGNIITVTLSGTATANHAQFEPINIQDSNGHGAYRPNTETDLACALSWIASNNIGNAQDIRIFGHSDGAKEVLDLAYFNNGSNHNFYNAATCDWSSNNFKITYAHLWSLPVEPVLSQLAQICSILGIGSCTDELWDIAMQLGPPTTWGAFTQTNSGLLSTDATAWIPSLGLASSMITYTVNNLAMTTPLSNAYNAYVATDAMAYLPGNTFIGQAFAQPTYLPPISATMGYYDTNVGYPPQENDAQNAGWTYQLLNSSNNGCDGHILDLTCAANPCNGNGLNTGPYCIDSNAAKNMMYGLRITSSAWEQGFDFRNNKTFVTDPPGSTFVLSTTAYPTTVNGVTFGWVKASPVQARDRNAQLDPRLAGIDFVNNGSPATFYVDVPSPGTYRLSLAMGDAGYRQCWVQCQVQFLDGNTVMATVTGGSIAQGFFYDAMGNKWSAASWPTNNVSQQVTLTGTRLTVVVGTNKSADDFTTIAFLGVTQVSGSPNFSISASPSSLSIAQGNQGTSTITTSISGGFNSAINLSASGIPSGASVGFNPDPIPAPGSGNSTMSVTVGAITPAGTYPITVSGDGGGIQQSTTVMLTVTAASSWQQGFDFRNSATFVTDPPGSTYVLATTAYPTTVGGVTFGWVKTRLVYGRDRGATLDPRLAGINFADDGSPATFNVDLPSAGTYNLSLALGDAGHEQCWVQCLVQFFDGTSLLATVSGGAIASGYFYDASGAKWSAAEWPTNNLSQQVTLTGTRLTVVVGTSQATGDFTTVAFLGLTQVAD